MDSLAGTYPRKYECARFLHSGRRKTRRVDVARLIGCFLLVCQHCLSHDNKDVTAFIPLDLLAADVPDFSPASSASSNSTRDVEIRIALQNRFVCNGKKWQRQRQRMCGISTQNPDKRYKRELHRKFGVYILSNLAWTSRMQSTKIILLNLSRHVARFNASIKTDNPRGMLSCSSPVSASKWLGMPRRMNDTDPKRERNK